jgi:hypothetical protein
VVRGKPHRSSRGFLGVDRSQVTDRRPRRTVSEQVDDDGVAESVGNNRYFTLSEANEPVYFD